MTDLPLIKAAKLWAKVSAQTGATYLTGRLGGCRVLVMENRDRQGEQDPTHWLMLGDAEMAAPDGAAGRSATRRGGRRHRTRVGAAFVARLLFLPVGRGNVRRWAILSTWKRRPG